MWHRRIALALAVLAAALLVCSGLGVRAGLWPFRFGFGMVAGALVAGLAAAVPLERAARENASVHQRRHHRHREAAAVWTRCTKG
jgi:ABC-type proline/glycine betaine transport system permease subunit